MLTFVKESCSSRSYRISLLHGCELKLHIKTSCISVNIAYNKTITKSKDIEVSRRSCDVLMQPLKTDSIFFKFTMLEKKSVIEKKLEELGVCKM